MHAGVHHIALRPTRRGPYPGPWGVTTFQPTILLPAILSPSGPDRGDRSWSRSAIL
jgi:hypothetical protein